MSNRFPTVAFRRALLSGSLALLGAAAACDSPFATDRVAPAPEPTPATALRITCLAVLASNSVSCDLPPNRDDGPNAAIIGGQGTYVRLTSSNIAVSADTFAFDVTVQNLLNETMGTADGAAVDSTGLRVFFHGPIVAVTTSDGQPGTVDVANEDGAGTFLATDQPYFRYAASALGADSLLTGRIGGGAGEISAARRWQLRFSPNVQSFAFTVYVDAQLEPLVAISEIMADPNGVADADAEYVELLNRGTLPVSLQGWVIQDGTTGVGTAVLGAVDTIDVALRVPGGARTLLGRSASSGLNGGIAPDFVYSSATAGGLQFSNSPCSGGGGCITDLFRIQNDAGVTVDSVAYTADAVSGTARERNDYGAGSANMDGAGWSAATRIYDPSNSNRGTPTPLSGVVPGANGGVSLSVDPAITPVGYDRPIFSSAVDSAGNPVFGSDLIWTSSNPAVATVDSLGYVTGLLPDTVTINAQTPDGGATGSIKLTFVPDTATHGATYRNHIAFGDPVDATPQNEFRITREQFVASYDTLRRQPNWVAWNLNGSTFGAAVRCDCFTDEPMVPVSGRSYDTDYRNSGYTRGHMVQSESRTITYQENATTFLLSNIVPQAANNNSGPWLKLETHLNDLVRTGGKEVYVVAGGQFDAVPPTLKGEGRVAIPRFTWKVALVLNAGEGLADVASAADVEVIAIRIPNLLAPLAAAGDSGYAGALAQSTPWENFVTSVDFIESETGYDVFALLNDAIEAEVEGRDGTGSSLQATSLAVVTQPSGSATTGTAFAQQPIVEVRDQNNNPLAVAGRSVTVSLASGTGTLNGTKTLTTASNGRVTFTNLSIAEAGAYTLQFASSGLAPATSDTVTVTVPVEVAPSVLSTSPADSAVDVSVNGTIRFTFNEAVTAAASAFALECPATTPHAFTLTGSGTATLTLTPSTPLPANTTCQVTATGAAITDVDANDPPDAMAGDRAIVFTTGAAAPASAVLRFTEFSPNISSSRDLIELVVVQSGTTSGLRITEFGSSSTTLATLPDVQVSAGDIIVVHLNPISTNGDAPGSETAGKSEHPNASYAANYDGAWDFHGGTSGIGFSYRVMRVVTSGGVTQDGVAAHTPVGTPPGGFPAALQALQAEGLWLPVNCGGAPCTYTSTPTAGDVSALWQNTGTSRSGASMGRVNATDTNLGSDWAVGANTFGVANP